MSSLGYDVMRRRKKGVETFQKLWIILRIISVTYEETLFLN